MNLWLWLPDTLVRTFWAYISAQQACGCQWAMSAVGRGVGNGRQNTNHNSKELFRPFNRMFLCCYMLVYWVFGGPGTIAGMKFNEVSSSLPNGYTLLYFAKSAWSLHPWAPWLSDLLRDLGQLALILFVSLERTVLIYRTVKPAPGSPGSNKQFPCLWQPFQSPLDTLLLFGSGSS